MKNWVHRLVSKFKVENSTSGGLNGWVWKIAKLSLMFKILWLTCEKFENWICLIASKIEQRIQADSRILDKSRRKCLSQIGVKTRKNKWSDWNC